MIEQAFIKKTVLGTVQLGLDYGVNNSSGQPSESESQIILDGAHSKGIQWLDTAEAYGNSQSLIGRFHSNSKKRFKIITKSHGLNKCSKEQVIDKVNQSLKELEIDSIDILLFHHFEDFLYLSQEKNLLESLKDTKINNLGVSVYDNDEIITAANHKLIDVIQSPFNLLDNKNQRGHAFSYAKEKEKEIHVRSIFLQGLFFMDINNLPPQLSPLKHHLTQLKKISEQFNVSIHQMALMYPFFHQSIDKVLFGVESSKQLEDNIEILSQDILAELFTFIDEVFVKEKHLLSPANWKPA